MLREREREDKNRSLLLIKRQEDRSHYSFFLGDLFVFREREREREDNASMQGSGGWRSLPCLD